MKQKEPWNPCSVSTLKVVPLGSITVSLGHLVTLLEVVAVASLVVVVGVMIVDVVVGVVLGTVVAEEASVVDLVPTTLPTAEDSVTFLARRLLSRPRESCNGRNTANMGTQSAAMVRYWHGQRQITDI